MHPLDQLQEWYHSVCDGDWEHNWGVKIGTLDNPGWSIEIELNETPLAERSFKEVSDLRSEDDWVVCKVESQKFVGYCGPKNLTEMISVFCEWSRKPR
ncbi:MAG: immunity 53 family protein [Planctomycetota bacterium]|nr:immunity 53 family protein [Planctomycetota bacterium]